MNNLQIFNSKQFGQVRVKEKDGEIWFVAKDICDCLNISNPTIAAGRLDDDERTKLNLGRAGSTNFVNEYGLYSLVLTSRKKEAKQFKRWITHEVLPEIRETGQYSEKPKNQLDVLRGALDEIEKAQKEAREAKNIAETVNHRVDNLDAVNLEGDLRQRLNKMIRKYAWQNGGDYQSAWNQFKQKFNTAYHTNIELLKTNYFKKTGRELSTPKILEEKDLLKDALRIADKMLNPGA